LRLPKRGMFGRPIGKCKRLARYARPASLSARGVVYTASLGRSEHSHCRNKQYSCYNKLSKFIKVHKDVLPPSSRTNVVYRIDCLDCEASYVGQTKRTLNTRVGEHRSHVRRNSTQNSVITDHRLNFRHEFDWDNAKILDEEMNYNKRLISEMIFIKKQKHGLNAQMDTTLLDPIYNDLLS